MMLIFTYSNWYWWAFAMYYFCFSFYKETTFLIIRSSLSYNFGGFQVQYTATLLQALMKARSFWVNFVNFLYEVNPLWQNRMDWTRFRYFQPIKIKFVGLHGNSNKMFSLFAISKCRGLICEWLYWFDK